MNASKGLFSSASQHHYLNIAHLVRLCTKLIKSSVIVFLLVAEKGAYHVGKKKYIYSEEKIISIKEMKLESSYFSVTWKNYTMLPGDGIKNKKQCK